MRKNKGYSLIELVVVISIMAVVGTGIISLAYSQGPWKSRRAATTVFNLLQQTRSAALAKSDAWVKLSYEDGECVLTSSFGKDRKLGKRIYISYATKSDGSDMVDLDGNPLVLTFSRGTGAFQTMKTAVSYDASGKVLYTEAGTDVYCRIIHVSGSKSGGKGYTITLHPVTGKFECEKD